MSTASTIRSSDSTGKTPGLFPATQWSVISQARGDGAQARNGLRDLALSYWRPLYLYLRKRGESHEDASDSVQGFFEFVFSSEFFSHIGREGGKFRSYLLKSLGRWRSRQRKKENARKRGGHIDHVALDGAEALWEEILDDNSTPEAAFDRRWASDLVVGAVSSLREDYVSRGRENWFDALSPALPGGGSLPSYSELAVKLGAGEGAIKKAVYDLRIAFANRLKATIRATVRTNEEAEEELRYLVSVISNNS